MANYGDLKARIADDLARTDLTTQIIAAISDAIDEYKDRRLGFNEVISSALPFTAGTPNYAVPTDFLHADLIMHSDGATETVVDQIDHETYRRIVFQPNNQQGQAQVYSIYAGEFWFYPTPDNSTDTYKVHYLQDLTDAAADETENGWTNQGRNLVRARAKGDLFAHVIRNPQEAALCYAEASNQLNRLQRQARRVRSNNRIVAHC